LIDNRRLQQIPNTNKNGNYGQLGSDADIEANDSDS
jgi:hypothetical protein